MKKNKIKRIISLVLSVTLTVSMLSMTAFAEEGASIDDYVDRLSIVESRDILTRSQTIALHEVLADVEVQKDMIGLSAIDFSEFKIGNPIWSYVYVNDTFEILREMYPITDQNDKLVLWAIEDNGKFQITSALVNEINGVIYSDKPFCIVYDFNSCYLYINDTFILLSTSAFEDESRDVLNPDSVLKPNNFETTRLDENVDLEYISDTTSSVFTAFSTPIYFSTNVKNTSQLPHDKICWAAVVASIVNCRLGGSRTAVQVAQQHTGSQTNFNQTASTSAMPGLLSHYGVSSYTHKSSQYPFDNVILKNIQAGFPLYGSFHWSNGFHAGTLYAINVIGGYLYVMDPMVGFVTATPASGTARYRYVGSNGHTLTLDTAVARHW